jgi:hypothetical protein
MDHASSLPLTMPIQLILDAEHGIGITKSALLARSDGFSMPTRSAFQFLINALQVM